ncbi:MAG TPA: alanine--glyoxylate aminotransferase family protein [Bacillota bacterium]|jgi:aspartate aminotransferase-like enzyme|nr:alanine--glyoxylate aminotransferase family protein [Bacillota bacterium]HOA36250.1 alanine--glyoxylate aminotransferase family protein [Bacillota bacterium]HOJ84072.1 alanine--glyoxylate aminotransferase family protein [Bacillota bacterium]HOL15370.1 alanine--glyoxylate aminotransferase family protein [Bacillota bacterium]HPZ12289.1 alanine--glyoxylate aminotransferase family protein [Bacillota bacterium]
MFNKRLLIPGPAPIPPAVARAMSTEMFNHRGPRFAELIAEVTASLKRVFQTESRLFILTSSGTGAMEAAVVNFLSPGDRIVSLVNGLFGDRFASIAAAYGGNVERLESAWGEPLDYAALEARLREDKDSSIRAITVVHNESSTGMMNDLEKISRIRGDHPALLLVDTVSSMGAVDLPVDRLGVDVCFTGSQKALLLPPGLSFISASERAWKAAASSKMPKYYFNLQTAEELLKKGQTPFTPALPQFVALREALQIYFAEGRENCYARHRRMASAVRAAARALGLEPLVKEERFASPTVTAIMNPPNISGKRLQVMMLERFGIEIAGGQGALEGQIFRVGHLGAVDGLDIIAGISALEICLQLLGHPVKAGEAVGAAEEAMST